MTTPAFQHIALIGKYQTAGSQEALSRLADFLSQMGIGVILETETALNTGLQGYTHAPIQELSKHAQLALIMGGDGTMLGAGRMLAKQNMPVIGVNQGRLGFMTDIPLDGYTETLRPMLMGEYVEERRPMMQASVWRGEQCLMQTEALNDVVVNRGTSSGMIEMRVKVNDRFVANHRADGLILASPTGSTAYALSAGGPILHPDIAGWVMVPIAPHTLTNRPIVLSCREEVCIEVVSTRDGCANFDMHSLASLQPGDQVRVRTSEYALRLLHPLGWSYFDTLRRKLRWNEDAVLGR